MKLRAIFELARNTGDVFLFHWYLILCVGLLFALAAVALLLFYVWRARVRLHQVFFMTVLLMGLLWSFVMPPLSAPDEVAHYISAYKLSSQILGAQVQNEKHQILIRTEDVFIDDLPNDGDPDNATVVGAKLTRDTYRELHARGLHSTGESGISASQQIPVSTTPFAYLPQALGFSLARLLGLGGFGLLYLGRLMNLLLFAVLGAYAVKRIPIGKEILFGTALLPMTMELVSSLSYDTYILALSFYLSALCVDLAFRGKTEGRMQAHKEESDQISARDLVQIAALAALLAPCKMVYAVLFGMCFLIPISLWRNPKQYACSIVLVGAVMVLAVFLCNAEQLLRYTNVTESVNELSWAGEGVESYTLAECLREPKLLCSLLFTTLREKGGEFVWGMTGRWMGNLDSALELSKKAAAVFWGLLFVLALFTQHKEGFSLRLKQRVWLLVLSFLLVAAICISMLAAYTPKGETYIRGIQGRYFLAGLPMFLLAFAAPFDRIIKQGKVGSKSADAVRQQEAEKAKAAKKEANSCALLGKTGFTLRARGGNLQGAGSAASRLKQVVSLSGLWLMLALNAWALHRLYILVCFRLQ